MVVLNKTSCEKSLWAVWTLEKVIFDVVIINEIRTASHEKWCEKCQKDVKSDIKMTVLLTAWMTIGTWHSLWKCSPCEMVLIFASTPSTSSSSLPYFQFLLSSVRFAIWFGTLWLICVISRRTEFSRNCNWSSSSRGFFCSLMLNVDDDDDISGGKNNIN